MSWIFVQKKKLPSVGVCRTLHSNWTFVDALEYLLLDVEPLMQLFFVFSLMAMMQIHYHLWQLMLLEVTNAAKLNHQFEIVAKVLCKWKKKTNFHLIWFILLFAQMFFSFEHKNVLFLYFSFFFITLWKLWKTFFTNDGFEKKVFLLMVFKINVWALGMLTVNLLNFT